MDDVELAIIQRRLTNLEEALLQLADFTMMTTRWLTMASDEETIALTNKWFRRQLDRILASSDSAPQTRDHLLRFARAFEELDSVPTESPIREKLWQDIMQQLRRETEGPDG